MIGEELIKELVERIVKAVQPQRIILFGSAARGEMTADSDIDLLILKQPPFDPRADIALVRRALRGLGFPFDILIMAVERFEESKDVFGGMAYPANKTGKVIYEVA